MPKFIELQSKNGLYLINVDYIKRVQPFSLIDKCTDILLLDGSSYRVYKSYDEVKALISAATK